VGLDGVGKEAEQRRHWDRDGAVALDGVEAAEAGQRRWTEAGRRRCAFFFS